MEEPLLPHPDNRPDDVKTAAADPGAGAPDSDVDDTTDASSTSAGEPPASPDQENPPFRTPEPGDSLSPDELERRSDA